MYFEHGRERAGTSLDQPTVLVEKTGETFEAWLDRPHVNSELRNNLSKANVLIVPSEDRIEGVDSLYFPAGTEELLEVLRDAERPDLSVDICTSDEGYQELARYADWLIIAGMVAQHYVAPVAVALTAIYIEQRLRRREATTLVKAELTVQHEDGSALKLSYEGPASQYRTVMTEALEGGSVLQSATSMKRIDSPEKPTERED